MSTAPRLTLTDVQRADLRKAAAEHVARLQAARATVPGALARPAQQKEPRR